MSPTVHRVSISSHDPVARPSGVLRSLARLLPESRNDVTGDAQRARLLAVLSLWLLGLCTLGCVQVVAFTPAALVTPVLAVVLTTGCVFAVAYCAARAGRTDVAAGLIVAAQIVAPTAAYLQAGATRLPGATAASWLSLALLTANAVLGPGAVVAVGAMAIATMGSVEAMSGADPRSISEHVLALAAVTMALFVYTRHRDRVELLRRRTLKTRNEELEQLRATLEQRVEERTSALEATATELRKSCDDLARKHALLVRTEKMAAVGRLTAGFAHELASPLGAVTASLDVLRDLCREYERSIGDLTVSDDDHREIVREMLASADLSCMASARAVTFVRGIRAHTRDPGAQARETFDVGTVVREVAMMLAYAARSAHVNVEVRAEAGAHVVNGVPSRLNQAVTNLLQNAIDATGESKRNGHIVISVGRDAGEVVLRVADDGPGIPAEVLPRIFEPLFTTKPYGKGTGLGLSIVAEIVREDLQGELVVDTRLGQGTTFVVRLPEHGVGHGA